MRSEIWTLKRVRGGCVAWAFFLAVALMGVGACLSPPLALPTPIPTSTAAFTPSSTRTPPDTSTSTLPSTATPTATPTPTPTTIPTPPLVTASASVTTTISFIHGPYLQSVTTDSIIVAWETGQPGQGEVAYGETGAYGLRVADPAVAARHAVTLTGLAPYTVYHYRVESGGVPLSEDATFRTAAGPDQTRFTFVVFGDTRTQPKFHQAVVERIVAQAPDFALNTGDLVEHGRRADEWKTFFEIERGLLARAPLFPVLGNHEGNSPLYFDYFYLPGNERWYTFDYGNARFVCLQVDGVADFRPGSEQYGWLEGTLAANTQPWLFVAFHVPPYTSVRDDLEDDVRQALTPLFERYGVDVVFSGHKHNYERNEVNGITYVVTAGGGAPLYAMQEREPTQAAFARAYHFVLVEIDGDHLQATVISSEGEVLDEFERGVE